MSTQLAAAESFSIAQRKATALAASNIVPTAYQGNVANCLLALEMSERLGFQPLIVMQNLHVIQGKPSWSSSFLIAVLNKSGKFSALRFRAKTDANGEEISWQVITKEIATGEVIEGPLVTLEMARKEGWLGKPGSKWQSMPKLMGCYRAAAFFSRLYAPELLLGFLASDEIEDIAASREPRNVTPSDGSAPKHIGAILGSLMPEEPAPAPAPFVTPPETIAALNADAGTLADPDLARLFAGQESALFSYLVHLGWITGTQTLADLAPDKLARIKAKAEAVAEAAGITLTTSEKN